MIILNVLDGIICSSIGSEVFSKTYSDESYKQLSDLADKANSCKSISDYKEIVEEFKKLCSEELSGHTQSNIHDDIYVCNKTNELYLKYKNKISSVPIPKVLVDRIKYSIDKKLDISPIIKFWIRFLRNPKINNYFGVKDLQFSNKLANFINITYINHDMVEKLVSEKGYSVDVAEKMCKVFSMKITNEGLLAGFKVSEEITTRYRLNEIGVKESYDIYNTGKKSIDPISGLITYEKIELQNEDRVFRPAVQGDRGDAFYCDDSIGHIIKVGKVHRLPDWSYVNTDDSVSCVKGLHIGGIDYIRGYQNSNTCTHNILVCPSKIGAVPDDSTGAIRCLEYYVLDEFSGINGSIYHSSNYATKLDEEWNREKEEIIKKFGEHSDENIKYLSERQDEFRNL